MKAFHTTDASQFLQKTQIALEQDEAANQAALSRCRELIAAGAEGDAVMAWTEDAQGVTSAALFAPPDPLWLFCEPQPKEASLRLLVNMLRDVPFKRVKGKGHVISTFSALAYELFSATFHPVGRQKIFRLDRCTSVPFAAGYMRLAVSSDVDQISEWANACYIELPGSVPDEMNREYLAGQIDKGNLYVWEDGLMVSMVVRALPTRHAVAAQYLYTPPLLRNRGYAKALVNALCQQQLQEGYTFCTATIDPLNEIANHVFLKLGFSRVCDLDEIEVNS
jgi:RimJ/RimL family protein N-acetyltransferase